jgi:hypothetical protein
VRPCAKLEVLDPDFDKNFALSGFSRVYQLEEVDTFVSDIDDISYESIDGIDGFDPSVTSVFDLHVSNSAPTHCDGRRD